ncbi:MerR family transcriptional regulator [Rhodococcus sp. H29-C3]|uniref:MerR family transcriptional regulator n=1 Tax=Rhodococcus sp. H29-C3 TaxID=3046307 RepID=UPI0024BBB7CC|nr:MerR family transcriptional regulator [Rhodococcus sp. H29-C3]MDJ0362553.1 MerR family transcriptional regulator [Rhodococcus sp. H29-C3]
MSAPARQTSIGRPEGIGIAEMAECSGLTQDTLRWYEREGLTPDIPRSANGRRVFTPRMVSLLNLLVRLRSTGMPTADMRDFVKLIDGGPATHRQRIAILSAHRARIAERQRHLTDASNALESKISHYELLISEGLDCEGAAVPNPADNDQ